MARATGPGKTEIRTNPASLMLFNFDVDGDALKREHQDFLRREAIPQLRLGVAVAVIGLADRKGSAAHNRALADKRVARTVEFLRSEVRSLNLKQASGFGEDAAAQEGQKDGSEDERFRSVLLFLSPGATKRKFIDVVAKSFINVIGANTGKIPGTTVVPAPVPGFPVPILVPVKRQTLLELLATATDSQFRENPKAAAKNKGYRLFSACRFTVVFEDGKVLAASPGLPELDTDVGTEPPQGGLQPASLIVSPVTVTGKGTSVVKFSWFAKGRPHPLAEPPFQIVQPRSSVFIWHIVSGTIDASSGTPVTTVSIRGSQFPTHRVFLNGLPMAPDQKQGPFSNLWVADPADATKVR
jgi:hypothetical protein